MSLKINENSACKASWKFSGCPPKLEQWSWKREMVLIRFGQSFDGRSIAAPKVSFQVIGKNSLWLRRN